MINSIRLINWRSHGDSYLEFKKGTNILMGLMGSGKSSVLDAISFALFGTFPILERRKLKLENVIRSNQNTASVVLEFEFDKNKYNVERNLSVDKRGITTNASLYKNSAIIEKGTVAVTKYVEQLLSIDYDLFTRAIYSEQNNIDYFLTIDPSKRKGEIDTLLGLDKFEIARANSVSTINRIKSERKLLEEKISTVDLKKLEEQKSENKEKHTKLEENIASLLDKILQEQKSLETEEIKYNDAKKKKETYDILTKEKIRAESTVENLKVEIADKRVDEKKLEELKEEKNSLDKKRITINEEVKIFDQELRKLAKQAADLDSKINSIIKTKQEIEKAQKSTNDVLNGQNFENLMTNFSEFEKKAITHNSEYQTIKNELKDLNDFSIKLDASLNSNLVACPVCGSEITKNKLEHIVEEKRAVISKKELRMTELEKLISETRDGYDKTNRMIKQVELLSEKISFLKNGLGDMELLQQEKELVNKNMQELFSKKNDLQKEIETKIKHAEKIMMEITAMENVLKKRKELGIFEIKLASITKQLNELKFDEKEFEQLRKNIEQLRIKYESLKNEKTSCEKELVLVKEILNVITKEIERLKLLTQDVSNLINLEEELVVYKNALLETQTALRLNLTEAINLAMNEIWHIFYPSKNYTALRLNVTEKDYGFEIFDSEWKALESIASGGERACAALTLRVAIAMVLTSNLSWLILDEPTHNLDKNAVELLSQTLQFKVPEVVEQTFVITHEETLMGSEFASSYRLSRDKENKETTKIEKI